MLSPKSRVLWIKWHAYLSCFFLPLALLYSVSGVLHLLEVEDGPSETFEYIYSQAQWPDSEQAAKQAVVDLLEQNNLSQHLPLPSNHFNSPDWRGWYDIHQEVNIVNADDDHGAKVIIEKNNFMRQLMYIHKGIASNLFKILGILLGISLLFSIISGALVALSMPNLKKNSAIASAAGIVTLVVAYLIS